MNRLQRRARRKSDPEPRRAVHLRVASRRAVLRIELPAEVYDRAQRLDESARCGQIGHAEHDDKLRETLRPYCPIDSIHVTETDLIRNPRLAVAVGLNDG